MTTRPSGPTGLSREFDDLLRHRRFRTVFQPVVNVRSGQVEGYEALVRGPEGSPLESATALLHEAYRSGRVVDFDWTARACASRAALNAELSPDRLLFLNVEPLAMMASCPPHLRADIDEAFTRFRIMLEVTERSLERDPRTLLNGIDRVRPTVAGLALDDVGSRTITLAMLPVVSVDVIKLDLTITQGAPTQSLVKVLDAAYEERERSGATVLCEGVETAEHFDRVRAMGAELCQGYFVGRPTPLPPPIGRDADMALIGAEHVLDVATPFAALGGRPADTAQAGLLSPLSRQILYGDANLSEPAVVIQLVPDPALFGPDDADAMTRLGARGVVTGLLGRGALAGPSARMLRAREHDPMLDQEWAAIVLSPGSAGAMLARGVPGTNEFEYGVTHDRRRVVAAARCLLRRMEPVGELVPS